MLALTFGLHFGERLVLVGDAHLTKTFFSKFICSGSATQICFGCVLFCLAKEKIARGKVSSDLGDGRRGLFFKLLRAVDRPVDPPVVPPFKAVLMLAVWFKNGFFGVALRSRNRHAKIPNPKQISNSYDIC
jgi:hypothetical protein